MNRIEIIKVEDTLPSIAASRGELARLVDSDANTIIVDVNDLRPEGAYVKSLNGGSSGAWRFTLDMLNVLKQFKVRSHIKVRMAKSHPDYEKLAHAVRVLQNPTAYKEHEIGILLSYYVENEFYSDWEIISE